VTTGAVSIGFDGLRVQVRSSTPEIADEVEQIFRPMVLSREDLGSSAPIVARFSVDCWGEGYRVAGTGQAAPECGSLQETRRAIRYHVTRAFLEARPERFWVHAAAACQGRRTVLMPGRRGRGKSTLVTTLARAGWRYLSDEAVPLDMTADLAAPFPLTPHVRVDPGLPLAPEAVEALHKQAVELGPDAICREVVRITEPTFVRYLPGASATLEAMTPGQAALELLESCLNYPRHGPRAVRYAADLAGRLPATRLTFGDVDGAVRLLGDVSGQPG
jgi:hypothetical protein